MIGCVVVVIPFFCHSPFALFFFIQRSHPTNHADPLSFSLPTYYPILFHLPQSLEDPTDRDLERTRRRSRALNEAGMHSMWRRFDSQWMKPIFGGRVHDPLSYLDGLEDENEEEVLGLISSSSMDNGHSPSKDRANSSHSHGGGSSSNTSGSSSDRNNGRGPMFLSVAGPERKDLRLGISGGAIRYHPPANGNDQGL